MEQKQYLQQIDDVIQAGPYKDDCFSLCKHQTPRWYQQDKFGIFIHWGVYSVPAFGNEWYPRYMYHKGSKEYHFHQKNFGDHKTFGYKDFIPMFEAKQFDPKQWAELFKASGARFVMPVAEHHDGFQMYDSELSPWNSKQMGPCRDVLGELKESVESLGMRICASSHRAEHWFFLNEGRNFDCDVNDENYASFYGPAVGPTRGQDTLYDNPPDQAFLEDWLVRTCEIVDKYQPKIVFFDWWIQNYAFKPYLKKFAAYYYNRAAEWGEEVAINAKFDAYVHGSVVKDIERGQLSHISPDFWQNDTSVAKNSWGYTVGNDYKNPVDIVCDLVDVVSKNGALMLNIGPKSDGTIPEEDANILKAVGKWLDINGEAIFGTTYWKTFGEGPTEVPEGHFSDHLRKSFTSQDIRFTAKGNIVYAIAMKWPEDGCLTIESFAPQKKILHSSILNIEVLGEEVGPRYALNDTLKVRGNYGQDGYPVVLKIEIE